MIQDTSRHAYKYDALPTLGERQLLVYNELLKADNLTNLEMAKRLGIEINTVTPRTNELVKLGLVTEDCKRVCRISGRTAIAWRAIKETLF